MKSENLPFNPNDVHIETEQMSMDMLIKRMQYDEIDLAPDFQRRNDIWDDGKQSRLIESMWLNIPIPVFYVDATDDGRWLVIDGLQRLNTVRRFVAENELRLTGLEFMMEHEGKKYSDLSRELKRRIEETKIVVHKIKKGTPEPVRYAIFKRVNTGGTPLNQQEIRHAVNQGCFTKLLADLADSKEFKEAVVSGVSSRRMEDQECVLRFMAFSLSNPESYAHSNMDDFLHEIMKFCNEKMSSHEVSEYSERFLRAMKVSHGIFRNNAFRKFGKKAQFNKALFEAVSVNIGCLTDEQQKILLAKRAVVVRKMKALLKDDKNFFSSISDGTGASAKIRYRFRAIKDMLQEILNS